MLRAIFYTIIALACFRWPAMWIIHPLRKHKKVQRMMLLTMLSAGLAFVALACFSIPQLYGQVWPLSLYTVAGAFFPYLYFLFIRVLTSTSGIRKKDFIWLLPIALFIATNTVMNMTMEPDELRNYILTVFNRQDGEVLSDYAHYRYIFGYWGGRALIFISIIGVFMYGNKHLKLYHSHLENYYSDLKGLADSRNVYTIAYSWIGSVLALVALCSENFEGGESTLMMVVMCIITLLLLSFIGKYGYGIEHSTEDLVQSLDEDDRVSKGNDFASSQNAAEPEPENPMAKYSQALKEALDEKVYLEPGIELVGLANRIGTNRTYLSNIIHDEYGQNFAEFINSRRIKYAIEMMENATEQYPVRYIAVKCGYSSLQTFYNNFAKYTGGQTPASYLKHP